MAALQAGARARGLKLAPCEATTGKGGGGSAGVGVATPTHRGWGGFSRRAGIIPRTAPLGGSRAPGWRWGREAA